MAESNLKKLGDIFKNRKPQTKKPPAYEWQELALKVIKELNIPNNKRSSVFKICKEYPKIRIEQAMNDTKELCQTEEKWQYFFKVISSK